MKKIHICGAFDRFNYGDLLFPVVLEKVIHSEPIECSIDYYGLVHSDLRKYGGVLTKPMSELKISNDDKHILIIAGGNVLGSSVGFLYNCFGKGLLRSRILNKLGLSNINNKISQHLLQLTTPYPFSISKKDFGDICVIYNAVGGRLKDPEVDSFLENIDYISVRDKETQGSIISKCVCEHDLYLSPDSATLISDIFPIADLEGMINSQVRNIPDDFENGYICFQASQGLIAANRRAIIDELKYLHVQSKLPVLLLPIGRASMHSDDIGLKMISENIDIPFVLMRDLTIYEIMFLIAKSKLFVGTSLHGNITAMSYSVPHIGLFKNLIKLDSYLKTWALRGLDECVDFAGFGRKALEALRIDHAALVKNSQYLISQTKQDLHRILNVIEKY